jgi:hypothetical protein
VAPRGRDEAVGTGAREDALRRRIRCRDHIVGASAQLGRPALEGGEVLESRTVRQPPEA